MQCGSSPASACRFPKQQLHTGLPGRSAPSPWKQPYGLIKLPKWCRNLWIGGAAIVLASATSVLLPVTQKDTLLHDLAWLLMHPAWGLGFFILVNRAVQAEHGRGPNKLRQPRIVPRLVSVAATIGVFSYSLYLTHELVIMQSWWFVFDGVPPILNTLLIVVPATVAFAWLFFQFCEKPFMRKVEPKVTEERRAEEPAPKDHSSVRWKQSSIADEA